MSNYRRARVPGGTFFFTVALEGRDSTLLVDRIDLLRGAFARMKAEAPVVCHAMVILPDHLHALWTLPPGDSAFPERWRRLKHRFTCGLAPDERPVRLRASLLRRREAGIWQRRYWEHRIGSAADFQAHLDYCRGDPVRHGLVARAQDWAYSSLHRDLRAGLVEPTWAPGAISGAFGEPADRPRRRTGHARPPAPAVTGSAQASQARSPAPSLTRVGNPIRSSTAKKGAGSSSSTLTMVPVSHVPSAISMAAATGGTPAV